MDMTPRRMLIVEDDPAIRELVRLHLRLGGHAVGESDNGRDALVRANAERFDLILLDLMLPDLDGITVCRAIRAGGVNGATPILMLTARDTESDKVLGLESGADDYLTKPFGVRELMARVAALLRRQTPPPADDGVVRASRGESGQFTARGIRIDRDRRTAHVRDALTELTRQEFDLLALLASQPGIVFSRAALLARVWSGDSYVTERTVDSVVSRLRKKVEVDPDDPELILTAWGVGYKFADAG
jgi:two-component system, OmpR family, alkaline phosphatase synthesis response regulator PhoP